jgi:uncharacterized protein
MQPSYNIAAFAMNLTPVVEAVLKKYALPFDGVHGVSHWARVLENGLRLAKENGANIEIVQLFAVFHDSRRINEGIDDGHGKRGADLAASLRNQCFSVSDEVFDLFHAACVGHTDCMIHDNVTIQTCWDADRLDLGRVGICLDVKRLCTDVAKRPEILKWADGRAAFKFVPELVSKEWKIKMDTGN